MISPQQLERRTGFASADEVRVAMTRIAVRDAFESRRVDCPKMKVGRRGLPEEFVQRMYRDYQRSGSVRATAHRFGRSQQAVWEMFRRRGLAIEPKSFHGRILFAGLAWTPGRSGKYRPTTGDRTRSLHHEIWMAHTGRKIPKGYQVTFRNGDCSDFRFCNLALATAAEVTRIHYARKYPARARMSPEELRAWWRAYYLKRYHQRAKQFIARGLRCDGKPTMRVLKRRCAGSEDAAFLRRVIAWPKTPRSLCLAAQRRLDELERTR
jgi:transposase-like protein